MDFDCYCDDGEPSVIYEKTDPIARIRHKCSECRGPIFPHEPYERVVGLWPAVDGWETFKTCIRCLALREFVEANVKCFCWNHSTMIEDAIMTAGNYRDPGNGLYFGALRRYAMIRRHREAHKQHDGDSHS